MEGTSIPPTPSHLREAETTHMAVPAPSSFLPEGTGEGAGWRGASGTAPLSHSPACLQRQRLLAGCYQTLSSGAQVLPLKETAGAAQGTCVRQGMRPRAGASAAGGGNSSERLHSVTELALSAHLPGEETASCSV